MTPSCRFARTSSIAGPSSAAGVGVGAVAQHHVEQEQAGLGIGRLLAQATQAEVLVDHRVQPADGELVGAQIDDRVARLRAGSSSGCEPRMRSVGVERRQEGAERLLELERQRAAGEQAAQETAPCRAWSTVPLPATRFSHAGAHSGGAGVGTAGRVAPIGRFGRRARAGSVARAPALLSLPVGRVRRSQQGDGALGGLFESGGEEHVARPRRRRRVAEEVDDDRLAAAARGGQQIGRHRGSRWLGDQHDDAGRGIVGQEVERPPGGACPDLGGQVAAAGAERVRDPLAQLVDAARDGLQPGA